MIERAVQSNTATGEWQTIPTNALCFRRCGAIIRIQCPFTPKIPIVGPLAMDTSTSKLSFHAMGYSLATKQNDIIAKHIETHECTMVDEISNNGTPLISPTPLPSIQATTQLWQGTYEIRQELFGTTTTPTSSIPCFISSTPTPLLIRLVYEMEWQTTTAL